MNAEIHSKIEGAFQGYNDGAIFRLINGQVWQQSAYKYKYRYAYRPDVRVFKHNGKFFIEVEGMNMAVPVVQTSIIEEGTIVSDFTGFNQHSLFKFENGQVWTPAEFKYNYRYAYRPEAVIIDGINGPELHVEDMDEAILVRRA